jgi:murein DD-endopeptidase MepM/ murein hydrolase activator NlpD
MKPIRARMLANRLRQSSTGKPDRYWRARKVEPVTDVATDVRNHNRRALRKRRPQVRATRSEPQGARRWAPLISFVSVGGLALVAVLPAYATDLASQTSGSATSASDQIITGSSGSQLIQRDGVLATAGYGRAGGWSSATYTNDPNGTIQWPFVVTVAISDLFGERPAPCSGCSTFHKGVDFDAGVGYPIQVIADGVVTKVHPFDDNGDGWYVEITHNVEGMTFMSRYCHLLPGSIFVSEGQSVGVRQILAQVGNTGNTTGAHLHFEIHVDGSAVDPYDWLVAHAN